MIKDKIVQRELHGRKPNGDRVRAMVELYRLGDQSPRFSVTTSRGCDHDSILAAFPELTWLVALHLSDENGEPMHSVANAIYHAREGDRDALTRHLRIDPFSAERIIGHVACIPKSCEEEAQKCAQSCLDEARAELSVKTKRVGDAWATVMVSKTKREMDAAKAKLDALDVVAIREEFTRAEVNSYVGGVVSKLRREWGAEAARAKAFMVGAGVYESEGFADWESDDPAMKFADGGPFNVEITTCFTLPMASDGGSDWYLAENEEEAGQAAREYWEDMARNDTSELTTIVGSDALIAWGLGESHAVGSEAVSSLDEWLDLWLTHPAEHFASYDGEQVGAWVNVAACEEMGIESTGEWTSVIAYRHN